MTLNTLHIKSDEKVNINMVTEDDGNDRFERWRQGALKDLTDIITGWPELQGIKRQRAEELAQFGINALLWHILLEGSRDMHAAPASDPYAAFPGERPLEQLVLLNHPVDHDHWSHPICTSCWQAKYGSRPFTRFVQPEEEICCYCQTLTMSGIYNREDPNIVHPPKG